MYFKNKMLLLRVREAKQKTIAITAFILDKIINKKVAKTKAGFLTLDWDT